LTSHSAEDRAPGCRAGCSSFSARLFPIQFSSLTFCTACFFFASIRPTAVPDKNPQWPPLIPLALAKSSLCYYILVPIKYWNKCQFSFSFPHFAPPDYDGPSLQRLVLHIVNLLFQYRIQSVGSCGNWSALSPVRILTRLIFAVDLDINSLDRVTTPQPLFNGQTMPHPCLQSSRYALSWTQSYPPSKTTSMSSRTL